MTSSKMNIPTTINVGYQKREDTYTKKLAYVIYTDAKGVLRKQTSWEGWRHKDIEPQQFDNVPTSGFVLNKKVGGYRHSWNSRATMVRVYDPRDFEFEISVSNLLFILQETSSVQGKGLEGDFVYAWDGKELILMPTCCQEYRESQNFTSKQLNKVSRSDIVEGCTYLMKDMTNVMYLGKHPWSEIKGYTDNMVYLPIGYNHIFMRLDYPEYKAVGHSDDYRRAVHEHNKYIPLTGYTKLADRTSTIPMSIFADEYTELLKSKSHRMGTGIRIENMYSVKDRTKKNGQIRVLLKEGDKYRPALVLRTQSYSNWRTNELVENYEIHKADESFVPELKNGQCEIPKINRYGRHRSYETSTLSGDSLDKMDFYNVLLETTKGDIEILQVNY